MGCWQSQIKMGVADGRGSLDIFQPPAIRTTTVCNLHDINLILSPFRQKRAFLLLLFFQYITEL